MSGRDDNVRAAAERWLWNATQETGYALRLYKAGHDEQSACHADAAVYCAKLAQGLVELTRKNFPHTPALPARRLARSNREYENFLKDAVKRASHSDKLLKKR